MGRIADVVAECIKRPGHTSVWSKEKGKFVCRKDPGYERAIQDQTEDVLAEHPPIDAVLKWALIAAVSGTLFFVSICVLLHLWTGGKPPDAMARLIDGLADMAKIGFGAVVGMLGSEKLRTTRKTKAIHTP